jgi:hypothetical protein
MNINSEEICDTDFLQIPSSVHNTIHHLLIFFGKISKGILFSFLNKYQSFIFLYFRRYAFLSKEYKMQINRKHLYIYLKIMIPQIKYINAKYIKRHISSVKHYK